jgi:hypothetical protein
LVFCCEMRVNGQGRREWESYDWKQESGN